MTNQEIDPFCEARFWYGVQDQPHYVQNPLSFITGLILCFIPLTFSNCYSTSNKKPIFLIIAKASLSLTGLGTAYFHAVSPSVAQHNHHINQQMCDWLPICTMSAQILILYYKNLLNKQWSEQSCCIVIFVIVSWASILIVGMDSSTESYWRNAIDSSNTKQSNFGSIMNAILLVPLLLLLTYCSVLEFKWKNVLPLWYTLFTAMAFWLLNAYTCSDHLWTSIFHSVYHLVIGYAFLYAICLGVCLKSESWIFEKRAFFWPTVTYRVYEPAVQYYF